jgi:hypothetical protein
LIYCCSLIEGKRNDDDSASVHSCELCLLSQIRPEPKFMLRQVQCLCPILLVVASAAFAAAADPPRADNRIHFEIEGPREIVATDNGDPTSFESFQSRDRKAFNGLCLVIVRGKPGQPGTITLAATAEGLKLETVSINSIRK